MNTSNLLLGLAVLAFVTGVCGCASRKQVILLDGWWDDDYAANLCQSAKASRDGGLRKMGCIREPKELGAEAEVPFTSSFQENPACKDITLYRGFRNPRAVTPETAKMVTNADWNLNLNVGISDETGDVDLHSLQWQIIDQKTGHRYAEGDLGNTYAAASAICRMVAGAGGRIQQ